VILDQRLTERGHNTRLHIIIESNAGLEAAYDIAHCSPRIDAMFFLGGGMAAELRCANAWGSLLYARSRVVHAAASAGLDVIDVPYLDLDDLEGMRHAAQQALELGFAGKGAVHPKQISALNEVFTPSDEQNARARRVISEFEKADTGLVVIDGKLIEKPVPREMTRIVATAEHMGS
jgi:(S)-citramalyl-CoA lyase